MLIATSPAHSSEFSFADAQQMLRKNCLACHSGSNTQAGFDLAALGSPESIDVNPQQWSTVLQRVRDQEMPPPGVPGPSAEERQRLVDWIDHTMRVAACADGITPAPARLRRLNRAEYSATVRDLLNIHFNAGHALPADGAGGEGFDNAAETLFLSPIHAEKYLDAAARALDYAVKDPKARAVFLTAEPGAGTSPEEAARAALSIFLPRAFRRPVEEKEINQYLGLYRSARRRGDTHDESILFALQGVLVSPHFLFLIERPVSGPGSEELTDYELASRLSYFLWGTMPDEILFDIAADGRLREPQVLAVQVARMLRDEKAREFAEQFTEQWLGTRELGRDIKPDPELFPEYQDAEIQAAFRYEPILFFQELLAENLSLLNILDSDFTILNNKLQRHYGLEIKKLQQQPVRVDLPPGTHRGGVLGMAAVLAVSSLPHRTSPVLRGKWILDAVLGTPPPPPPPDVPELDEAHDGSSPATLRARLERHRQNPACASCHSKIDPLGFGLENFDVLGRWRTEDAGQSIDGRGELPDGTKFEGPDALKAVLLQRKDLFLRNLTAKTLGYALGRGLTTEDYCTVDQIVEALKAGNYRAHTLIQEIVRSVPFRYKGVT